MWNVFFVNEKQITLWMSHSIRTYNWNFTKKLRVSRQLILIFIVMMIGLTSHKMSTSVVPQFLYGKYFRFLNVVTVLNSDSKRH